VSLVFIKHSRSAVGELTVIESDGCHPGGENHLQKAPDSDVLTPTAGRLRTQMSWFICMHALRSDARVRNLAIET